jgi:hypothetical protein
MKIVSRDGLVFLHARKSGRSPFSMSYTLDRGFIEIHQRLNNRERTSTTTGYVE